MTYIHLATWGKHLFSFIVCLPHMKPYNLGSDLEITSRPWWNLGQKHFHKSCDKQNWNRITRVRVAWSINKILQYSWFYGGDIFPCVLGLHSKYGKYVHCYIKLFIQYFITLRGELCLFFFFFSFSFHILIGSRKITNSCP